MADILSGFHRYCAARYFDFKNDLNGHLKKHSELGRPCSISTDHQSKYIEYSKDPYVQVLKYLIVTNTL